MAVDSAKLLLEISKSMSTIRKTLENKILNGFIGADPTKISATAIKNLKNSVKISSGITGSSTKNVPNDVFTAFATMISNDLSGSKIKKFETNDVKRTSQIASALKSGIKNEKKSISVNGTNYSIEYNIVAYAGVGVSSAHVRWKDKNKKNQHIILTWTNVGTQQGNQALAEYCSLLTDFDADLWKDFFKEVLKSGAKTWIVANYGEQILNAITDKVYAKNFLEDLGFYNKDIKAEKFEQFIADNVVDGDEIVSAAKLLKTLEKKQTALVTAVNNDKNIESKLKAFTKTCNKLETKLGLEKSTFSVGDFTSDPLNISNSKNYNLISGTTGNDTISNYGEHVTINSGAGNDSIYNVQGDNSTISCGDGNDYIINESDNLIINGGSGDDYISNSSYYGIVNDHSGYDTIDAGSGSDVIDNIKNNVTIYGGTGNDTIYNDGGYVIINCGKGDDYIENDDDHVTIEGGAGSDYIENWSGGNSVVVNTDYGHDSILSSGNNITINAGVGNDSILLYNSYSKNNVIKYSKGDGKDTVVGFNSDDTLQITKGSYKVSTKNNDVIVKVGTGSITLKDAVGREISIKNSSGKVTTKIYGSSSANVAELFEENNFVTNDNLSEIVENNLTPTALEKIETNNFENLAQENNLITYSEK